MALDGDWSDILVKVSMFILVQALVFLVLSNSSNIFSATERSQSFRPSRSVSLRRMLAVLSDLPPGGELSPQVRSSERKED